MQIRPPHRPRSIDRQLDAKRRWARAALWWEALLPRFLPLLLVVGLFLAAAFADLLPRLPSGLHFSILLLTGLVALLLLWRALRDFRRPTESDLRRRIERDSGVTHRPLDLLDDRPATEGPLAETLWQAHRARMLTAIGRLRVAPPAPRLPFHDPIALRVPVLLLLAFALWEAGPNAGARLGRARSPGLFGGPGLPVGLQVWLTPPPYTGEAPIVLDSASPPDKPVTVPAGSGLLAVLQGGRGDAELTVGDQKLPFTRLDDTGQRLEGSITAGDRLVVRQRGDTVADWKIAVVADQPPQVAFTELPEGDRDGRLRLAIAASDDYGLTRAWAEMRRVGAPESEPVLVPLPLPAGRKKEVAANGWADLTGHIWAGLPVTLTPVVQDAKEQQGRGATVNTVLPERSFRHPVARALAEIRRQLAASPDFRQEGAMRLDIIAARPGSFGDDLTAFLAMRVARFRLIGDGSTAAIGSVMDILWQTALRIEEGGRPQAERFLADAMQELQEALDRDAPPEEIERLMNQLQAAMAQMMRSLAEQAERQGAQPEMPADPEGQTVTDRELQEMVERMRDLAQTGARDAAREMLSQLQQMMQNLQASSGQGGESAESRAMQQALSELQKLPPRQQELMDQTFRQSPEGQESQSPTYENPLLREQMREMERLQRGQQAQPQGKPNPGMAQQQDQLRRQLGQAMQRLGESGLPIPGALGQAEQAMRDAGQALRQGDMDGAGQAQGEALDAMRQGLREAMNAMSQQMGQQGQAGMRGRPSGQGRDPLGRPLNGRGLADGEEVEIPSQGETQRAREILDELRRRASEADRGEAERGYLRRLLDLF